MHFCSTIGFVLLLAVLTGTGCSDSGGSSGSGGTPADVAGYWDLYQTVDGTPGEFGPDLVELQQSGSTVVMVFAGGGSINGTVSGNTVVFTAPC